MGDVVSVLRANVDNVELEVMMHCGRVVDEGVRPALYCLARILQGRANEGLRLGELRAAGWSERKGHVEAAGSGRPSSKMLISARLPADSAGYAASKRTRDKGIHLST